MYWFLVFKHLLCRAESCSTSSNSDSSVWRGESRFAPKWFFRSYPKEERDANTQSNCDTPSDTLWCSNPSSHTQFSVLNGTKGNANPWRSSHQRGLRDVGFWECESREVETGNFFTFPPFSCPLRTSCSFMFQRRSDSLRLGTLEMKLPRGRNLSVC